MQPTFNLNKSSSLSTTLNESASSSMKTWVGRHVNKVVGNNIFEPQFNIQQEILNKTLASQLDIDDLFAGPYLDGSCDNFMRTSLFKPFLDQLRFILNQQPSLQVQINDLPPSSFKKSFLEFYKHLNHLPVKYSIESNRLYYTQFLTLLHTCRKEAVVIDSTPSNFSFILVRNFLDKFIQDYMKEVSFYQPGMDFLYKAGLSKNLAITKMSDMGPALDQGFKQISHHHCQGVVPGLFDPNLLGNIPYQTFELQSKNGKNIKVFRSANITKDEEKKYSILTKSSVCEQFNLFLDAYAREGKKHLYVNLMKRNMSHENETLRSEMIENLETDYPGALNVVSLDRNSSFYFQQGFYLNLSGAENFKNDFKNHLKNDEFYYWSKNLNVKVLHKEIGELIEHIHKNYFQSSEILSYEKRQAFIELAYCMIIDTLISKMEPDSCNFSCKSCIDRGGLTNATMYLYYLIKKQGTIRPDQFNYLQYLTFLPALLVGNRQMQFCYFQRLMNFVKVFLSSDQILPTPLPQNDYIQAINVREISAEKDPFDPLNLDNQQRLKWRNDQFIMRKKLPLLSPEQRNLIEMHHREKLPMINDLVRKRIAQFNLGLKESQQSDMIDVISSHYILTMQYYAPVIVKWMDSLLQRDDDKKLVFLARDGIVFHDVASILLSKNPKRYSNITKDKLVVAWLSRKSTKDAANRGDLIERYFKQLGINSNDQVLLVDTGCTGSIKKEVTSLVKNKLECQFSVSRNPTIPGFWDNCDFSLQAIAFVCLPSSHKDAWANDPKRANDWVEDTHRGNSIGAEKLVEQNNVIYPYPSMEWIESPKGKLLVTKESPVLNSADLKDFLVREFGRQAILDFAQEVQMSDPAFNYNEIKLNLNDLLTRIQKKEIHHASCQHD